MLNNVRRASGGSLRLNTTFLYSKCPQSLKHNSCKCLLPPGMSSLRRYRNVHGLILKSINGARLGARVSGNRVCSSDSSGEANLSKIPFCRDSKKVNARCPAGAVSRGGYDSLPADANGAKRSVWMRNKMQMQLNPPRIKSAEHLLS